MTAAYQKMEDTIALDNGINFEEVDVIEISVDRRGE